MATLSTRRFDAIDAIEDAVSKKDAARYGPVLHEVRRPATRDDIPFQRLDARSISLFHTHRREILSRDRGRGRLADRAPAVPTERRPGRPLARQGAR